MLTKIQIILKMFNSDLGFMLDFLNKEKYLCVNSEKNGYKKFWILLPNSKKFGIYYDSNKYLVYCV